MASNINTTNIDTEFPIAGQDNDSQGFRDNFTNTNTNFVEAKAEIEALQDSTSIANYDFNPTQITEINLDNYVLTYNHATGFISLAPGGASSGLQNIVEDLTPQLGGALDVNGHPIVSAGGTNIVIEPDGNGSIVLDTMTWPSLPGTAGEILTALGSGQASWLAPTSGIGDLIVTSIPASDTITSTKDLFALEGPGGAGIHMATAVLPDTPDSGYDFVNNNEIATLTKPTFNITFGHVINDGSKVMWNDNSGANPKIVHVQDLATPYDLTTAGTLYDVSYTGSDTVYGPGIFKFSSDGLKAYALTQDNYVEEIPLTVPYDLTTAGPLTLSTDALISNDSVFSDNGLHLYSTASTGLAVFIFQYDLSVAWDITTLVGILQFEVTADLPVPLTPILPVAISNDGAKIFGLTTDADYLSWTVHQWDLATPYDLGTAVYNTTIGGNPISYNYGSFRTWSLSIDGTNMYFYSDTKITQFDIAAGDSIAGGTSTTVEVSGQLVLPSYTTATLPNTTITGGVVYDTDTNTLKYYDSTSWSDVGGGGGAQTPWTSDVDANGFSLITADILAGDRTGIADSIIIAAGSNAESLDAGSVNITGGTQLTGGQVTGAGGSISLTGGNVTAFGYAGSISLTAGTATADGYPGHINITSGIGTYYSGNIKISTPATSIPLIDGTGANYGAVIIEGGDNTTTDSTSYTSGVSIAGGNAITNGYGGNVDITGGSSGNDVGGMVTIGSGNSTNTGATGSTITLIGGGLIKHAGSVNITGGNGGDGGAVVITAGDSTTATLRGGSIDLIPGTGPLGSGDVIVRSNLIIEGSTEITAFSERAVLYGTTGAVTLDTSVATYFYSSATTGSITFSFINPALYGRVTSFTLEMLGASNFPPVWPASVTWPGGTEPTWTIGIDVVRFFTRDNGVTWLGVLDGTAFA